MPPNVLTLKFGAPIILLRNLNPPQLCNGTRLSMKNLVNNIIEAIIWNGKFKVKDVLLLSIPMIPTDMPFEFKLCSFRWDSPLQWPSTKHKNNCYKCIDWIWKIHVSHIGSSTWHAHKLTFRFICVRTTRENKKYCLSKWNSINII